MLQHGAVALYHRKSVLEEDRAWLLSNAYHVYEMDAGSWTTTAEAHAAIAARLEFPSYYGANLAALVDCLGELRMPAAGGAALIFRRYDLFARREPAFATALLEAIESTSRHFLLFGRRFLALVQSEDATLRLPPVGARPIVWNPREAAAATRASSTLP